ncbi:hypothetical protein HBA12_03500 [Tenacibaculum mesophilum]|uniref:hypothetical protein n=1 Tax=Tenacibaculum mesophilum TaxID=104268 RepID=UPI00143035D1|nr:hypothetical protein [Tenacibaculum mesophilum]KAF9659325.1 hypothetical protein HBA12_03500 [Tenacibaculum mesophilum]
MEEVNLVQKWIDTDKKLYDTLVAIQNEDDDKRKQAELVFLRVPKMYNLPVFTEDNEDDKFLSSVYEQLALLNYLEPEGDIRGRVLSSIFHVKEDYLVDMKLVYKKQFNNEKPPANFSGIGYKGNGIDVLPVFVMEGQSWFDLGCNYFTKEIDLI